MSLEINTPEVREPAWCVINVLDIGVVICFASTQWALLTTRRTRAESITAISNVAAEQGIQSDWKSLRSRGFRVVKCEIVIPGIHQ